MQKKSNFTEIHSSERCTLVHDYDTFSVVKNFKYFSFA